MPKSNPNILRLTIAFACALVIFFFFDPIGFASTNMANHMNPGSSNAVTHIVLFQFKKDSDAAQVETMCAKFMALKENCVLPNSQHQYIKSVSGGRDNSPEGLQGGLTHAFIMSFENTDGRNYYLEQDPAHQAFKKEVEPLVEKVTVLDFINGVF